VSTDAKPARKGQFTKGNKAAKGAGRGGKRRGLADLARKHEKAIIEGLLREAKESTSATGRVRAWSELRAIGWGNAPTNAAELGRTEESPAATASQGRMGVVILPPELDDRELTRMAGVLRENAFVVASPAETKAQRESLRESLERMASAGVDREALLLANLAARDEALAALREEVERLRAILGRTAKDAPSKPAAASAAMPDPGDTFMNLIRPDFRKKETP
jgi:hypothetical protein